MGVDLNRNFDFLWEHTSKFAAHSNVSTSDDPCNRYVYRGPSPASEPETQNVLWLLDTHPEIRWMVDLHSAVPVILHSWGSDQNQSEDETMSFLNPQFDGLRGLPNDANYKEFIPQSDLAEIAELSEAMNETIKEVRQVNYGFEQAYGLYPTSGASDDYAYSRHFADASKTRVLSFCIECGSSFQPPWSEAEEVIKEVSAGMIRLGLKVTE